jgi:hypothetical protein
MSLTNVFRGAPRMFGLEAPVAILPVVLPFVISCMTSKRLIPTSAILTRLFALAVVIGTAVGIWRIALADSVGSVLLVTLVQAVGFTLIANAMNTYAQNRRDA